MGKKSFKNDDIEEIKQEIGSFNFCCQYQQRPVLQKNSIIKKEWIKIKKGFEVAIIGPPNSGKSV